MIKSKHYLIRKLHRYLGLFTGIQFILWTIGGLYFSWSDIDEIHGDYQKKAPASFSSTMSLASPAQVLAQLQQADSVKSIKLVEVLGDPLYQVVYYQHEMAHTQLADAGTGQLRAPLTEQEAVKMALNRFVEPVQVAQVELLTEGKVGRHHEYRESPLPAYAVSMQHPTNTTVYIATERAEVISFRNNKWRVFDFLWMLHTMDYEGRDNFGNVLLRLFSVVGLVTVLSGFALYFVSFRGGKRGKKVAASQPRAVR